MTAWFYDTFPFAAKILVNSVWFFSTFQWVGTESRLWPVVNCHAFVEICIVLLESSGSNHCRLYSMFRRWFCPSSISMFTSFKTTFPSSILASKGLRCTSREDLIAQQRRSINVLVQVQEKLWQRAKTIFVQVQKKTSWRSIQVCAHVQEKT